MHPPDTLAEGARVVSAKRHNVARLRINKEEAS
jgi:hypothetical protein